MSRPFQVTMIPYTESNPYQNLLARHLESCGFEVKFEQLGLRGVCGAWSLRKTDVVHIHWLWPLLRNKQLARLKVALFLASLLLLRTVGKKIVWTVHNLYAHEPRHRRLDHFLRKQLARCAHAIIIHSQAARTLVLEAHAPNQQSKLAIVPHAHYIGVYPNTIEPGEARKRLNIDPKVPVLLCLGLLRSYKGTSALIRAFIRLKTPAVLIVAGKPANRQLESDLRRQVEGRADIRLVCEFIADQDLQLYINACDAMVFPYREVLTSGAVILAMSFSRACVAPRCGGIPELVDERGGFLFEPDQPDSLYDALRRAVQRHTDLAAMGEHNHSKIKPLTWARVAQMTGDVYRRCMDVQ